MKSAVLLALGVSTTAYAGYGGMGNVEDEGGGTGDLSDMVWGALIIGAIYLVWKKFF